MQAQPDFKRAEQGSGWAEPIQALVRPFSQSGLTKSGRARISITFSYYFFFFGQNYTQLMVKYIRVELWAFYH